MAEPPRRSDRKVSSPKKKKETASVAVEDRFVPDGVAEDPESVQPRVQTRRRDIRRAEGAVSTVADVDPEMPALEDVSDQLFVNVSTMATDEVDESFTNEGAQSGSSSEGQVILASRET
ncbi:hypothetical protein BD626DRAFT_540171, partial [Schizophyllum amplum]